jgi:hypothetical protein
MVQSLFAHTPQLHIYMAQFPLLPLPTPLCFPFVSPSTYLAPSSCDRNRPPLSQAACKLTPFAPLHPVDPPFPNSQNPTCPAPNNDDLGNILALGVQNTPLLRSALELKMGLYLPVSCCLGRCPWPQACGPRRWPPGPSPPPLLGPSSPSWPPW